MSSINFNFDNVYLLFIEIPLVLVFTVPLIVLFIKKKDNRNGHNIASMALHIIMAVLIAFAAAGTSVITTVTETNVYVVADVSYSANKNLDVVDSYIRNINLPPNSKKGVICFGKDYKLITRLGEKFVSVKNTGIDDSETNIIEALNYAGTLFRDDVIKRIVLITDGKQTYESDSNALKRTVDSLYAKGIRVDAMFLDDNINDSVKEVQISDVEYSQNVYLNRSEAVSALVQSSYDTQAVFSLYRDGIKTAEIAANLTQGTNTVTFDDIDTSSAGTFEYRIDVTSDGDESDKNNSIYFTQTVSDSINVLVITESAADNTAITGLYGEKAQIDSYVNKQDVPSSVEALCKYDEIIISNADVSKLNSIDLFLESLNTVVQLFGKSLITIGDTGLQSDSEGNLKVLSDMLPVNYGESNRDSKLLTIVMDTSRSMNQLSKLTRAKSAAYQLLDLLNDDDRVCVVIFHGDFEIVQAPTDAANRDLVKEKIGALGVTQGTFISLGLSEAFNLIKDAPYDEKQVMLISDGISYTGDSDDPLAIVRNMYANGIATSVIDVGRGAADSTSAVARAGKELLENIAAEGKGTYYYAADDDVLKDEIFSKIDEEMNESVINRSTSVTVNRRRDETVEGISDLLDYSYVNGFINSKTRASATTVLTVDYYKQNGGKVSVPLYAYWKCGNGKVATFTSSISGTWIAGWQNSGDLYTQFFNNVFELCIPDEKIDYPFLTAFEQDNGRATVSLTPAVVRPDSKAEISVQLPDGSVIDGVMTFDSTLFAYSFAAYGTGKYTATVTYSYADQDYTAQLSFTVPYLSEYDSFTVFEASGLYKMLAGNGGTVSEDGTLSIVNDDSVMGKYITDLTVPLLIISVVLFAADIVVRKLKWEDIRSLFGKVKK